MFGSSEKSHARDYSASSQSSFTDVTSLLLPQHSPAISVFSAAEEDQTSWTKRFYHLASPRRRITSLFGLLLCLATSFFLLQTSSQDVQSTGSSARLGSVYSPSAFSKINPFARQPIVTPPTKFVNLWQNEPFPEGYETKRMALPDDDTADANITAVMGTLRSAVVERHIEGGLSVDENSVSLRFFFATWDLPLSPDRHQQPSKLFWENHQEYSYNVTVSAAEGLLHGAQNQTYRGKQHYQDMREIAFAVEKTLFEKSDGDADRKISVKLDLLFKGKVAASWDFKLQQNSYPYTRLAICLKPLYGVSKPGALSEWREHHRMLGFDAVHFSSRNPMLEHEVDRMNSLTGGYDSFRWGPNLQRPYEHTIWDQELYFNECYGTFRQTAEWIGVWDVDELIAPVPDQNKPWTRDWVHSWVDRIDPSVKTVDLPYTWVDRVRQGPISNETLLEVDPTLSPVDLYAIGSLHQAGKAVREQHDAAYVKSLHRTSAIRGANVHHGVPGQGTVQSPVEMVVYHARNQLGENANKFATFNVTASIVQHWKLLTTRLHESGLKE